MIFSDLFFGTLYQPILNLLVLFYHLLGENLGLAIIAITIVIKIATYPLTKPSLLMAKKQKEIAPELRKIKDKYKDRQVQAQKQMELYKAHGINPASGCLPQIIQLILFIVLYRVFIDFLNSNGMISQSVVDALYSFEYLKLEVGQTFNTQFLFYDLASVDKTYTLPLVAAIAQFFMSKVMQKSNKVSEDIAKTTPDTKDDFMYNMQEGMIYTFPLMTFFIGMTLPAGLSVYWLVSTVISLIQYLLLNRETDKTNTVKEITNGAGVTSK